VIILGGGYMDELTEPGGALVDPLPAFANASGSRPRSDSAVSTRVPIVDFMSLCDWDHPLDDVATAGPVSTMASGSAAGEQVDEIAHAVLNSKASLAENAENVSGLHTRSRLARNSPDTGLGLRLFQKQIEKPKANLGGSGPPGVAGYDTLSKDQSVCKGHQSGHSSSSARSGCRSGTSSASTPQPIGFETHELNSQWFDELGRGDGGIDALDELRRAELSRRVLLMNSLLAFVRDDDRLTGRVAALPPIGQALKTAHVAAPESASEILLLPSTGVWMVHSLRRYVVEPADQCVDDVWVDVSHLWALALVMHAKAKLVFEAELPLRNGRLSLPALGLATFDAHDGSSAVIARTEDGVIALTCGSSTVFVDPDNNVDGPDWLCLRRITVASGGVELKVWLDDIDPFRNFGDPVMPERLSGEEVQHWNNVLQDAMDILVAGMLDTARLVAHGMVALTPIASGSEWIWTTRSGSTGDAFASAVITRPENGLAMAEALVHEFQHNKFSAILHVVPLCHDDDRQVLHAPWRDDPRPVEGFLHGIYAFAGIAKFWGSLRPSDNEHERRFARYQFALWRRQLTNALSTLEGEELLTPEGRRFFTCMTEAVAEWPSAVDGDLEHLVELLVRNKQSNWRIRHHQPDVRVVTQLCEMRRTGFDGRLKLPAPVVIPLDSPWNHDRIRGLRDHYVFGECDDFIRRTLCPGDVALIDRDFALARERFLAEIFEHPGCVESWSGLGLALYGLGDRATADVLYEMPEMALAVYRQIRSSNTAPEVIPLLQWMSTVLAVTK
jgi:HEXXH motif-containing protein